MSKFVYCDFNATSPVLKEVSQKVISYLESNFGNPSSIHRWGQTTRIAIENARDQVADLIGASRDDIIFTSGGSEGNNFCIKGLAKKLNASNDVLVTSLVEHSSVINTFKSLESLGFHVIYLKPDSSGVIYPDQLSTCMKKYPVKLVSLMSANNETGSLNPIDQLSQIANSGGAFFHTDAVQWVGRLPLNISQWKVDALVASGHKMGAMKGVGFVYLSPGLRLEPLIAGGHHERDMRAGTENVPGIVGLGIAADLAKNQIIKNWQKIRLLVDYFIQELKCKIPNIQLNGWADERMPNTVNICFPGMDAETLVMNLDLDGIGVSTGSACLSGGVEPSHVLMAIGCTHQEAKESIRFSFGWMMTKIDIDYVIERLHYWIQHQNQLKVKNI